MSLPSHTKLSIILLFVVLIGFVFFFIFGLNPSGKDVVIPATKIAVIDSAKLKSQANCFKGHESLEVMLSSVVAKMRKSELQAKSDYEKVKNDKTMAKKQVAKSIERIEEKWNVISKQYKKEVEDIKKMDLKLSDLLQQKIYRIIEEIAEKYKIDIVLNNQIGGTISVFYSTKNVDITNMVINKLNNVIPHVDLEKLK